MFLFFKRRQFLLYCELDDTGIKEKEMEHSSLQEQLDKELKELDQKLEEKEVNFFSMDARSLSFFHYFHTLWKFNLDHLINGH